MNAGPIRYIAIAGHGFEAWFVANHLLAALGGQRIEIRVCPVPGATAHDDFYSVLPVGAGDGLAAIGLEPPALLRQCAASFSLGVRFNGRHRPYGDIGQDIMGLAFHQHWLRHDGEGEDYFDWSPATAAMRAGRFAPPIDKNAIGSLRHGMAMHVDTERLTGLLRTRALNSAAAEWTGTLDSVERDGDGRISKLLSDRGEPAEADLFIDCSGPQRALVKGQPGVEFVRATVLGEFSCTASRSTGGPAPDPFHAVSGSAAGWDVTVPGNGWTAELELREAAAGDGGFIPGHMNCPWTGNCVAIGHAAATLLPTEPLHARLLTSSIGRLLDLLPDNRCAAEETAEYNHLFETDLFEAEDLGAVYEMARAGEFTGLREAGAEGSLADRLELFRRRGWVMPTDSELLQPRDWVAALLMLGLVPERHDRLAERLPREKLDVYLGKLREQIRQTAKAFPPHERILAAAKPAAQP